MKSSVELLGINALGASFLLTTALIGCAQENLQRSKLAQQQQVQKSDTQPKPTSKIAKQQIKLLRLNGRLDANSGLKIIGDFEALRGSFCFAGFQDGNRSGVSIIQRLDIKGKRDYTFTNFYLPASTNPLLLNVASEPMFLKDRDEIYFKWVATGDDVEWFDVYKANLKNGQVNKFDFSEPLAVGRILFSPNSSKLAFVEQDAKGDSYYNLLVRENGQDKNVSEHRETRYFNWSPRNTLIYSLFSSEKDRLRRRIYPDVYEDDLQGNLNLLKKGGYGATMSFDYKTLASFVASKNLESEANESGEIVFDRFRPKKAFLSLLNIETKVEKIITPIYEKYPDLMWTRDSRKLYVVENYYTYSKRSAFCKISCYDIDKQEYRLLCNLQQRSDPNEKGDEFKPAFKPIKLAGNHSLLIQVAIRRADDKVIYNIINVDLQTGNHENILQFNEPRARRGYFPFVDWLDSSV